MKMKKYISILLVTVMVVLCFSACGQDKKDSSLKSEVKKETVSEDNKKDNSKKIKVVTTIFPEYDWVKQIVGENNSNVELTMLVDNGVDLHSYQPTAADIMKISDCDLFIYVGGESDKWVDDALKQAVNKDMKVINLLDVLGESVKEEEVVEGMQAEDEEEEEGKEEEPEYDEHVWLSVKNAKTLCAEIEEKLAQADASNAQLYQKNLEEYQKRLSELDEQYKTVADGSKLKTLIFGDRFPFRYLTDDYNLSYYAAFVGCSAETEASFKTIKFLAEKADELNVRYIMTIEKSDKKIAKTSMRNTKKKNQKILTLNSMQSTTSEDVANGVTYYSVMKDNLKVLTEALK